MAVELDLDGLIAKYRYLWEFWGREPTGHVNDPYDCDGDTLLHHVAYASGVDELNLLVASGANISAPGDLGYTPLHFAAMRGSLRVVERLLELAQTQVYAMSSARSLWTWHETAVIRRWLRFLSERTKTAVSPPRRRGRSLFETT